MEVQLTLELLKASAVAAERVDEGLDQVWVAVEDGERGSRVSAQTLKGGCGVLGAGLPLEFQRTT